MLENSEPHPKLEKLSVSLLRHRVLKNLCSDLMGFPVALPDRPLGLPGSRCGGLHFHHFCDFNCADFKVPQPLAISRAAAIVSAFTRENPDKKFDPPASDIPLELTVERRVMPRFAPQHLFPWRAISSMSDGGIELCCVKRCRSSVPRSETARR